MGIETTLTNGAPYERQLAVGAHNDGDLRAVVAALVDELR